MSIVGDWAAIGPNRHELGEGARAWNDGFVHVDLLAGDLYRVDDGIERITSLDVPLGAVAPRASGGWIAAAGTGIGFLDTSDGDIRWLAQPLDGASVPMRMNDGVADPHGRFWAGGMPYGDAPGTGILMRVDIDGTVSVVLEGLTIPNGPAFSPDGSVMYLAESSQGTITRYSVDGNGGLGSPELFASVDDASPDGMTVDAEGCLWSALWGGSRLHRYSPGGDLVDVVDVPAAQPTSVALSTSAPYRILVTTANHGLPVPNSWDGATLSADTTVEGVPTAYFAG